MAVASELCNCEGILDMLQHKPAAGKLGAQHRANLHGLSSACPCSA